MSRFAPPTRAGRRVRCTPIAVVTRVKTLIACVGDDGVMQRIMHLFTHKLAPLSSCRHAVMLQSARPRGVRALLGLRRRLRCCAERSTASAPSAETAPSAAQSRRAALAAASSLVFVPPPALAAAPQETALFGGGDPIFLEYVFDNLRYAGVSDVVVGVADGVRCVLVTYNPQRINYERLLGEFWRNVRPTQADGQFDAKGAANRSVIWASSAEQRAAAERTRGQLQRSVRSLFFASALLTNDLYRASSAARCRQRCWTRR